MQPQTHSPQRAHGPASPRPTTVTLTYAGVEREVAILVPSRCAPGTPLPLVFALHGGGGDAGNMYAERKGIGTHAESDGFIAVFPNGLPRPDTPASHSYFWADPVNIDYMAFLIDELIGRYAVDTGRIYFVGFSGGAQLIYRLAADPAISARIAGVGTIAGLIGGRPTEPADAQWELIDPSVTGGCPMPAFLVQGGQDERLPAAGGFGDAGETVVIGFETKVAIWRHFTGARAAAGDQPPALPPGVTVRQWTNPQTGCAVVAVVDDRLAHEWPTWDFMGELWGFFQSMPACEARPDV